jgi:hypothetical protein
MQANASSYAALAFTKHLIGDLDGAIDYYHQSLSRKPDDPFASEMLNRALQDALNDKLFLEHRPVGPFAGSSPSRSSFARTAVGRAAAKNLNMEMSVASANNNHLMPPPQQHLHLQPENESMMTDEGLSLDDSGEDIDMSVTS